MTAPRATMNAGHHQAARAEQVELLRLILESLEGLTESANTWARARGQESGVTLETRIGTFGADGTLSRGGFRATVAAVSIFNPTNAAITVSSAPRQAAPPNAGVGAFIVPPRSWARMPLAATELTFYGTAGQRFSYSLSTATQPAAAGSISVAGDTAEGAVVVPANGTAALAPASMDRNSLLVVNTGTVALNIGYDPTGAANIISLAVGADLTVNGGRQLYATNPTGTAGNVAYLAD